ncbi:MAG: hypothetical protein KGI09_08355 [Thaumarchaeota archaeon]|nr:hypothetical protein [Nitrososphaerota archaeon]
MSNGSPTRQNFLVLQIDVKKHTEWLEENETEKHPARKVFGECIISSMEHCGFLKFSWAGDGGVFVLSSDGRTNYDIIVDKADKIYEIFELWQIEYAHVNADRLGLRVSADVMPIIVDGDPSFWTSVRLNKFLKSERRISEMGFAITGEIKNNLSNEKRRRFDGLDGYHGYKRVIGIPPNSITIWYDSNHRTELTD